MAKHRPKRGRKHPKTFGWMQCPGQHRDEGVPVGDPQRFERIHRANKKGWWPSR